jgi:hypothetical protein
MLPGHFYFNFLFAMKKKQLAGILLIGVGMFFSCKKENTKPDDKTATKTGTFLFHLHTYLDNNEVDLYNIPYTTLDGRSISLSIAQLYISDVQLVKLDGSTFDLSGKKVLKVLEKDMYAVGDVPVGNYRSFRFKVGLNAKTNAQSSLDPADSSILNQSAMWMEKTAQPGGYVFMNVQGTIDTSSDMSGAVVPFAYKIGTNAHYVQVNMPDRNFTVLENQAMYGHVWIDYHKLFTGIPLNQAANLSVVTAADNSLAIAGKIAANIPFMFIYE